MRVQSLALLAGAALAAADSTVTIFLPGFDAQSLEGKILGSKSAMTTYVLNCPTGEDPNDCGLPGNGYTVTAGSSSVIYGFGYDNQTISQTCNFQGTTHANCEWTEWQDGATSVSSTDFDMASIPYGGSMAVHITATQTGGVAASTGASASASTAASTTAPAGTGMSTSSTTIAIGTASETKTASATASHTKSSNAAMPKITGNARLFAGGAAAALVLAVV
ncbi:uncharacterized protein N7498_002833 [Penicillium cinerascens]|uniref:Uncharacterized protein n=1 Tax=Penicillium cinerascens TaxID=70096 RepID=A0A9W9TBG7_9EURO|nr:uncharacterized protein N7498_002833 [Penicillium cinerascens]KAJ5216426.1 hypothetical protein N7498_002833 [Penicillium cinerascens]